MRIAVINWSRRRIGGTETYLSSVIPKLFEMGHDVSFLHERNEPATREEITLPEGVPAWCVSDLGTENALAALRDWRPEIIYNHSLHDTRLEERILDIAPSIFFAHTYYGTCISGSKAFKYPVVKPCARRFGWKCLLHYYPKRCGGWNPFTMMKLYLEQMRRLDNLRRYKAVVTHSKHMASECIKHGIATDRIYNISYYSHAAKPNLYKGETIEQPFNASPTDQASDKTNSPFIGNISELPARLLFLGRMDRLKGGDIFLNALPQAEAMLGRPIQVTFAGDGTKRSAWEKIARRLEAEGSRLSVNFVGWVESGQLSSIFGNCDLLVFPSLWPEPFGLIGLEAGKYGVPVAAFAVGGIPDWLHNGVNGYLASGDPPTSDGLAEAIYKCLRDPITHARLCRGAVEVAKGHEIENHLSALTMVFAKVAHSAGIE